MKPTAIITGFSMLAATAQARLDPKQEPAEKPGLGRLTSQGCFSSRPSDMKYAVANADKDHISSGACAQVCDEKGASVLAVGPDGCFCGDKMPPKADLVDDEECNYACPAFGLEACGSMKPARWSLWNLGKEINPPEEESSSNDQDDDDESSSITSSSITSSIESSTVTGAPRLTRSGNTTSVSTTATGSQTTGSDVPEETDGSDEDNESDDPSMGSSLAGSVAAVAAIAGGSMWFLL